jgi:hypothetical protein
MTALDYDRAVDVVRRAWLDLGDERSIAEIEETSAHVSTNRVFRLSLSTDETVVAKVSNYGSFFLFAEDHDRLFECTRLLQGTRWADFLATILTVGGRPYRWYDGTCWVVFYVDVPRGEMLGGVVAESDIDNLATEMAEFHAASQDVGSRLPAPSHSIRSDAVTLYDELGKSHAPHAFEMSLHEVDVARNSVHELLLYLESVDFDRWPKIPVLVDWNLGNFSITRSPSGRFSLYTRWDYDWFRIDTRMLDFYFLSRVSSATGDRTTFTYSPHTLLEPRFLKFLVAYHSSNHLREEEIDFLPWAYRFFILNYVIRDGSKFFRRSFIDRFKREAVSRYLPTLNGFDVTPLKRAIEP